MNTVITVIIKKYKKAPIALLNKIRRELIPNPREKEKKKWNNECGETLRYKYKLKNNSFVVDVGGYKGQWASDIYAMYNCNILIIEPVYEFALNIENRFKYNNKINILNIALGKNKRTDRISINNDGSSIFKKSIKYQQIRVEDVKTIFTSQNIKFVDLMKINIEGGEYELLNRMIECDLIAKIKNIQIQFHDFVPDAKIKMVQIHKQLKLTHRCTFQYKFVWENWQLIE